MKLLRNTSWGHILVVALVLGVVATTGAVRSRGVEPLAVIPAAAPDGTAPAFLDIFLEIEGIPGEATAVGHRGAIEVLSWSWGVSQTATGGGGGAVGRGDLKGHVTLIKRIDKATPLLFTRCAQGTHIPRAVVHLTREDGQTYLKYELKEVLVSSMTHAGDLDGDGHPDETLELTLGGTTLTHTQFDVTGKPVGQTTGEW